MALTAAAALAMLALNQRATAAAEMQHSMQFYGDAMHEERQVAFMQFLARYGKTYASKNDISNRFNVFAANYDKIKEHNQKGTYKMGINHFSDLTVEEV